MGNYWTSQDEPFLAAHEFITWDGTTIVHGKEKGPRRLSLGHLSKQLLPRSAVSRNQYYDRGDCVGMAQLG